MSTTDFFMQHKRRKTFKRIINNNSDSSVFKFFIALGMSIVFIIVVPIMLVLSPFILAWDFATALTWKMNEEEETPNFFGNSKWGNFNVDFDSWKHKGE